ncbi:MAG TPA: OsmC family protein [Chlamydiales bacterium]|nr:OsmC family protein [Chlamydiales bacterium]
MKFEVRAAAPAGTHTQWTAQNELLPPIPCAIPPEFMGPGEGYSPEDLFAMALLNCLIATFKVYCEMAKVTFQEIQGRATITLDKQAGQSSLAMTQADIFLDVSGASDQGRVRKLLDNAVKDCAVSNSIKTGKTFHINVS